MRILTLLLLISFFLFSSRQLMSMNEEDKKSPDESAPAIQRAHYLSLKEDINTNPWHILKDPKENPSFEIKKDFWITTLLLNLSAYKNVLSLWQIDTRTQMDIESLICELHGIYRPDHDPRLVKIYHERLCKLHKHKPLEELFSTAYKNIQSFLEETHIIGRLATAKNKDDVDKISFDFNTSPDTLKKFHEIYKERGLIKRDNSLSNLMKITSYECFFEINNISDLNARLLAIKEAIKCHPLSDTHSFINKQINTNADPINKAVSMLIACANSRNFNEALHQAKGGYKGSSGEGGLDEEGSGEGSSDEGSSDEGSSDGGVTDG